MRHPSQNSKLCRSSGRAAGVLLDGVVLVVRFHLPKFKLLTGASRYYRTQAKWFSIYCSACNPASYMNNFHKLCRRWIHNGMLNLACKYRISNRVSGYFTEPASVSRPKTQGVPWLRGSRNPFSPAKIIKHSTGVGRYRYSSKLKNSIYRSSFCQLPMWYL